MNYHVVSRCFVVRATKETLATDQFGLEHVVGVFDTAMKAREFIELHARLQDAEDGIDFKIVSLRVQEWNRYQVV